MTLNKQSLANNDTLVALAARLKSAVGSDKPVKYAAPATVKVGGLEIDIDALEVALTALKLGKWTSIKPALKSVDSPLVDIDYQEIADREKKTLNGASTKEAFVHHLEEVAREAGVQSPILDEPINVVKASTEYVEGPIDETVEVIDVEDEVQAVNPILLDAMQGAMVALLPTPESQEKLAKGTGTPPDQIHLTLRFLGNDHTVYSPEQKNQMIESVRPAISDLPYLFGNAFGVAIWNPQSDSPALVLNVGGADIERVHKIICDNVECDQEEHKPWAAHITMDYTRDLSMIAEQIDKLGDIEFDRVRFAFGGDNWDIPLGVQSLELSDVTTETEGESNE